LGCIRRNQSRPDCFRGGQLKEKHFVAIDIVFHQEEPLGTAVTRTQELGRLVFVGLVEIKRNLAFWAAK